MLKALRVRIIHNQVRKMTLKIHKVNTWLKTVSEEIIIKGLYPTLLK